jgi:hypothetical protein
MDWFHQMIRWHPVFSGALAMGVANCIVTTMPTPEPRSSGGMLGHPLYQWAFNCLHSLVLAIPRIASQYNGKEDGK